MKKHLIALVTFLIISAQAFSQVAPSFDIFILPYRFSDKSMNYFRANGFETKNVRIMTQGNIKDSRDNSFDPDKVKKFILRFYPDVNSNAKLVLDWESDPFKALRDHPENDNRFKAAERKFIGLVDYIKRMRPNLKLSYYSLPNRTWSEGQSAKQNPAGKYDNIMAKLDFVSPSLYLLYTDEEVGHERNLKYMKDNLDVAMAYGRKFSIPVYPFLWHRVHANSPLYPKQIVQKDVYASYFKFVRDYSYKGTEIKGVYLWDGIGGRLDNLKGIKNWLKGSVYNASTYDNFIISMAKTIKQTLNSGAATESVAEAAEEKAFSTQNSGSGEDKVMSYTLTDAKTGKDIQTLSNGAILNLAKLPTNKFNIRANTNSDAGSVAFSLSGEQSKSSTESLEPYEIMGDNGRWVPSTGSYTLKAIPYSGSKATGKAGSSLTINFTVVSTSSTSSSNITEGESFTLVNADNDQDIQTLTSGATINLAALSTENLNIRYNPGSEIGSVVLRLSGRQSIKVTESGAPYAFEDDNGDYKGWKLSTGSYTVKATPYSDFKGAGKAGSSLSIDFTIVNNTNSKIAVTSLSSNATAGSNSTSEGILSADVLTVYPVPATTVLYVDLGQEVGEGVTTIELKDLSGQVVLTKKMNTATDGRKAEFDLNGVKEGLYVLAVSSSAGRVTKRIVIN